MWRLFWAVIRRCNPAVVALSAAYVVLLIAVFTLSRNIAQSYLAIANVSVNLPESWERLFPDTQPEVLMLRNWEHPSRVPEFHVVINPGDLCQDSDLFLFIYVHSAPGHLERRTHIRKTYGNPHNFPNVKLQVMFIVGITPNHSMLQLALEQESAMHHDILQEDFVDSYRNLSFKGIAALRYIQKHCQHVSFILKTDDDIFVNIFSLVPHLRKLPTYGDLPQKAILCLLWHRMPVIRNPKSKWFVPREEWPPDYYNNYCSGSAFILTPEAASAMYQAVGHTPFHWVDDFYITGLLANAGNVTKISQRSHYRLNFKQFLNDYHQNLDVGMTRLFSHAKDLAQFRALWNTIARKLKRETISDVWFPVFNHSKS